MTDEYVRKEDVLKEKRTGTFPNGICLEAKACVTVEYIKSLEPADVAPVVHAYWIDTDNYYRRWRCSACSGHTKEAHPLFCPFCGAKMDGKE